MVTSKPNSRLLQGIISALVAAFFFAVVGMYINKVSDAPCSMPIDETNREALEYCKGMASYMKAILIATHLLAFALLPFAMRVFWVRAPLLEGAFSAKEAFNAVLGFAFLMVSIMGEIGWHVSQQWFYQEEYHILNFVFYFFYLLGVALWADGVTPKTDSPGGPIWWILDTLAGWANILVVIAPLVVTVVYGAAATLKFYCPTLPENREGLCAFPGPTKIPIYLLMLVQFAVLSIRLFKLLNYDHRVWVLPFFSVVVNLVFIMLLGIYQEDPFFNPLFHTLHDLLGTLLGVFLIILLIWEKTNDAASSERQNLLDGE